MHRFALMQLKFHAMTGYSTSILVTCTKIPIEPYFILNVIPCVRKCCCPNVFDFVQSFEELCEELYVNLELYFKNTHWKNILQKKCIWFDEKNIKSVYPVEGGQEPGHGLVNMYMHHMNIDCMRGWPLGNITLRKPLRTKAMFVEIYKIYKSWYSTGFREKTILIVTMFYWSRSNAFDAKWLKMSSSSEIIAWLSEIIAWLSFKPI